MSNSKKQLLSKNDLLSAIEKIIDIEPIIVETLEELINSSSLIEAVAASLLQTQINNTKVIKLKDMNNLLKNKTIAISDTKRFDIVFTLTDNYHNNDLH